MTPSLAPLEIAVTFDVSVGEVRFEWAPNPKDPSVARGQLTPAADNFFLRHRTLDWQFDYQGDPRNDSCGMAPASVYALLRRIRQLLPLSESPLHLYLLSDVKLGAAEPGRLLPIPIPPGVDSWKWLGRHLVEFARLLYSPLERDAAPAIRGRAALRVLAAALLRVPPAQAEGKAPLLALRVTFTPASQLVEFVWSVPETSTTPPVALGIVRGAEPGRLRWKLEVDGRQELDESSSADRDVIRALLGRWLQRFRTGLSSVTRIHVKSDSRLVSEPRSKPNESPYPWIEDCIVAVGEISPAPPSSPVRKPQKRIAAEAPRQPPSVSRPVSSAPAPSPRAPTPPVPVAIKLDTLTFQETAFPLSDLNGYWLRERAALWWVSNQSDDLLCLPNCRIQRLDYQIRTALRVLGPLRGRALLSDEVGLGKTIEAGLVMKELLTRGLAKRFLVLTLPSLVDQWAEELADKFGLTAATTNQPALRDDATRFWREHPGIVASLHTLKQPAHLEIAQQIHWDILIVDEAHYLRNRTSQAWQAVNALPRQFLLLLTATPVQNSLEELYNLVTLLQPGQLPAPRDFRARFIDPQRPRQPREPEELRRLLGQVMIRNTRANAGIELPPRHAETVLISPDAADAAFWQEWETDFRTRLAPLSASQASLWGRLLLQAAGSSPAAWRAALTKFPDADAARRWRDRSPLEASWRRKCDLLAPLTRATGGAVVFTQFLATQTALANFLRNEKVNTFVINGSTPPSERQPIAEEFRARGGALLLTQSGTEGRNLQFCHTLANFDLPWNPMEIEQRIGRLHRLGQRQPVRICNFVQAGTLQEHLLQVLQEKLNLFELVVGETGLVLGERFSGDEFEEEVFRRWHEGEGRVAEALAGFGDELAEARNRYAEVKQLDETLFAKDFESL